MVQFLLHAIFVQSVQSMQSLHRLRTFIHASGNCDACIDAWSFALIVCEIQGSEFNILWHCSELHQNLDGTPASEFLCIFEALRNDFEDVLLTRWFIPIVLVKHFTVSELHISSKWTVRLWFSLFTFMLALIQIGSLYPIGSVSQLMSYQKLIINSVSSWSESESADSKSASKSSLSNSISWVPSNSRSQDLRSSSSGRCSTLHIIHIHQLQVWLLLDPILVEFWSSLKWMILTWAQSESVPQPCLAVCQFFCLQNWFLLESPV